MAYAGAGPTVMAQWIQVPYVNTFEDTSRQLSVPAAPLVDAYEKKNLLPPFPAATLMNPSTVNATSGK
jgi:hypothetical protein